jgi:hypothetical protein
MSQKAASKGEGEAPHITTSGSTSSSEVSVPSFAEVCQYMAVAPDDQVRLLMQMCAARLGEEVPKVLQGKKLSYSKVAEKAKNLPPPLKSEEKGKKPIPTKGKTTGPKTVLGVKPRNNIRPGLPGSGYTLTKSGKLVKNKRPKTRSLFEREARNWRVRAQNELKTYTVSVLKKKPSELKSEPLKEGADEKYDKLFMNLALAKAYQNSIRALLKQGLDPQKDGIPVAEWRKTVTPMESTRDLYTWFHSDAYNAQVGNESQAKTLAEFAFANVTPSSSSDESSSGDSEYE